MGNSSESAHVRKRHKHPTSLLQHPPPHSSDWKFPKTPVKYLACARCLDHRIGGLNIYSRGPLRNCTFLQNLQAAAKTNTARQHTGRMTCVLKFWKGNTETLRIPQIQTLRSLGHGKVLHQASIGVLMCSTASKAFNETSTGKQVVYMLPTSANLLFQSQKEHEGKEEEKDNKTHT